MWVAIPLPALRPLMGFAQLRIRALQEDKFLHAPGPSGPGRIAEPLHGG